MDWEAIFLLELMTMRMTGFVVANPLLGRANVPGFVKAGFALVLTAAVYGMGGSQSVRVPGSLPVLALSLLAELGIGLVIGFVLRLFFSVVQTGGEIIDAQMGLTMAQTYDASAQANLTVTGALLNILMVLIFFAENGHYTLFRILLSSGELLPYGTASSGPEIASHAAELFLDCMVLSLKLALPILAAELLGEIGMGILMKAIPQINAFVINMELKVFLGLALLFLFLTPISEFLLGAEQTMLEQVRQALSIMALHG